MKKEHLSLQSGAIKKRQYIILGLTIIALLAASCVILLIANHGKITFGSKHKNKILIEDPTKGAKAEDRWLERSESRMDRMERELNEAKSDNSKLKQNITELNGNVTSLQQKHETLSSNSLLSNKPPAPQIIPLNNDQILTDPLNPDSNLAQGDPFITTTTRVNNKLPVPVSNKIEEINANLSEPEVEPKNYNTRNTKNYLPAGSYAKALIISGVDASVGVTSQSDPRPMLFRVIDPAISAVKDGITHTTDISGCMVTGAAYGDLSSEKVFIRLLKMTCSEDETQVIETDVKGYVAGLGKAGVRGVVVSREGDLVAKSFAAGLAGGLGDGVASRLSPAATISGGLAVAQPTNKQVIGEGVGKGFSKSSDRLADYLIHRAEQYQPVVSVASGLKVELVFEEGVYLDGRSLQNNGVKNDKTK